MRGSVGPVALVRLVGGRGSMSVRAAGTGPLRRRTRSRVGRLVQGAGELPSQRGDLRGRPAVHFETLGARVGAVSARAPKTEDHAPGRVRPVQISGPRGPTVFADAVAGSQELPPRLRGQQVRFHAWNIRRLRQRDCCRCRRQLFSCFRGIRPGFHFEFKNPSFHTRARHGGATTESAVAGGGGERPGHVESGLPVLRRRAPLSLGREPR